jgi:DNA-binding NarL/FixJ family response regulator
MSRILICDDHALVRGVLRGAVQSAGHTVVGEAGDGETALALAAALRPHVVLMDLSMPGIDGLSATRRMRRSAPDAAVLVITMHAEPEMLATLRDAGAMGYLLKDAGHDQILEAVNAVARGEEAFDPDLSAGTEAPGTAATPDHDLTDREVQVLELVADGASPREVAELLIVSPKTVGNHLTNIYAKLDVHSRSQAVIEGLRRGLVQPPRD